MKKVIKNNEYLAIATNNPQNNNNHGITTQNSNSPRAYEGISTYNQLILTNAKENTHIYFDQSIYTPFNSRTYFPKELVWRTLSYCKLQDILNLRLVSKGYCQLISFIKDLNDQNLSFLAHYAEVTMSVNDLHNYMLSNDSSSDINYFKTTNLKIKLQLTPIEEDTIEEVNLLNTLILKYSNSSNIFPITNITAIELDKIDITLGTMKSINDLLITISQNPTLLPNLTALSFGNIGECGEFDDSFDNSHTILTIPNSLNHLSSLSFQQIAATLILPSELNNLTALSIRSLYENIPPPWPNKLNNLISLHIGTIFRGESPITLPQELNSLTHLSIESMLQICIFPPELNNLTTCSITDIELSEDATLIFPSKLNNLTSLILGFDNNDGKIVLPNELDSLTSLHIGTFCTGPNLIFPSFLKKLALLSIETTDFEVHSDIDQIQKSLKLSESISNVSTLTINEIKDDVLAFPNPALTINRIGDNVILKIGSFGQIGSNLTLITPTGTLVLNKK